MFKQILKTIWNQRSANAWIWAEMLLVSLCLWYVIDDLYMRVSLYVSPMGNDISDTYIVDLRLLTSENQAYQPQVEYGTKLGEDLLALVDRIRAYPGVETVGLSFNSQPYSYDRNYTGFSRIVPETNDTIPSGSVRRYMANPDYLRVFRHTNLAGHTEVLAENLADGRLLITREVEEQLFPEGNGIGKPVQFSMGGEQQSLIGGVMMPVRFDEFDTYTPTIIEPFNEQMIARSLNENRFGGMEISLRIDPAFASGFAGNFRKEMKNQLRYHNIYLLNIRSYKDIRDRYLRNKVNDFKLYLAGVFFLLVNIFLGVVGTFFFRTQQRQGEMGVRIALGATSNRLRSLLIDEGVLLLALAFLPALMICLNLGLKEIVRVDAMPFTATRFFICQAITFALMACMIIGGIWFPARKVIHLQPAEALHYE